MGGIILELKKEIILREIREKVFYADCTNPWLHVTNSCLCGNCITNWLSGSGGYPDTFAIIAHFLQADAVGVRPP
jgi:hypothetical protein